MITNGLMKQKVLSRLEATNQGKHHQEQGGKALNDVSLQITDERLMLAYGQGQAMAFDKLYQRHKVAVFRYFLRQNISQAIAEELSHDTWLKIINARESYVVSALFKTYLFTGMPDIQPQRDRDHRRAERPPRLPEGAGQGRR